MVADVRELQAMTALMRLRAQQAPERADKAVRKACADNESASKGLCPVRTGFLRSTISSTVKSTARGAAGEVGPTAYYGGFVELGTSRMGPQPYMQPGFDRTEPGFIRALELIGVL